ncbi:peptidyl-prolyl cis-trans isomerase-like 4 [Plakobranchus ocellatus]|uniref:Peptidyl-prolyl cis-trans isomerase n=1 Tax=Plakobranchus ocellatus TaxID=259542 RepID=A0AAV4D865_9GAST|nr:peptidyl-prolyl cis-trans isomerase-like 4 [Plakobranchus ocellatus]
MICFAIILVVACDPSTRAVPLLGGLPRQFARRSEESTSSKTILAALLFLPLLITLSSRVPDRGAKIYHTIILDDPFDDPENLPIPAASPGPTQEMLNSDHIPCDADIDEDKGKTEAELAEIEAEKEAKANTQILEMVGDLPSADVAPPENVLFVCKLNPVTTSEDLEIIFSRFGKIVNCDVIKDSKTGESLQYAFIEFEKAENCESAYFKMDNVLIDDRRIHVDFSQSVSKLKWKGKGKGVDILSSGDAPVYVLKNQQRQDDRYDLVYEEDVPDVRGSKKTKQRQQSNDQKSRSSHREYSGGHGRDHVQQRMDRQKNQDYTRGERKRSEDRERRVREDKDTRRNRERKDREETYRSSDRERRQEEERDRSVDVEKRQHKRNEASDDEAIKYRGKGNRESDRKAERTHKPKNKKRHERRSSSIEDSRDVDRGHHDSDSEDNRRERGRSGSRDRPNVRVKQKRKHDREMNSGDNSRRGRGRSSSRDCPNMRVREKGKQDRESSSDENNDKWTGCSSEGRDFSYGATRKDKSSRQDINSESDKETKRQKSKKSKKHKRKTSPDSDHKQNSKRKKKKLKHSKNGSDSD